MSAEDIVFYIELGIATGIVPSVLLMVLGKLWRVIDIID